LSTTSPGKQVALAAYTGGLFGCAAILIAEYAFGLQASYVERINWLFPIFWIIGFIASGSLLPTHTTRAYCGFAVLIFLLLVMGMTPVVVE